MTVAWKTVCMDKLVHAGCFAFVILERKCRVADIQADERPFCGETILATTGKHYTTVNARSCEGFRTGWNRPGGFHGDSYSGAGRPLGKREISRVDAFDSRS